MLTRTLSRFAVGVGVCGVLSLAAATHVFAQVYPPYGPDIPVITNTEPASGAYNEDRAREPAPGCRHSCKRRCLSPVGR